MTEIDTSTNIKQTATFYIRLDLYAFGKPTERPSLPSIQRLALWRASGGCHKDLPAATPDPQHPLTRTIDFEIDF